MEILYPPANDAVDEGGHVVTELPKNLLPIDDGATLAREQPPPLVQLVEGILVEGTKLMIGSYSKAGKTWNTIDLALAISHGVPFWGRTTKQCPVLYLNLELRRDAFLRRLQRLAEARRMDVRPGRLHVSHLRGYIEPLPVMVKKIIATANHYQAKCVIVDPVYKLLGKLKENSAEDMAALFGELDRITTEANCAVVINDHFSKGDQSEKDPMDRLAGSGAKGRDADSIMVLTKHEQDSCYTVSLIHRELPPQPDFVIEAHFPLMVPRDDLDPAQLKRPKSGPKERYSNEIILKHLSGRMTLSEWLLAVQGVPGYEDMSRDTMERRAKQLSYDGKVEHDRTCRLYQVIRKSA